MHNAVHKKRTHFQLIHIHAHFFALQTSATLITDVPKLASLSNNTVTSTGAVVGAHGPGGSRGEGVEGCDPGPEHGAWGLEQPGGGAAEQRQFTGPGLLPYGPGAGVQLSHSTLHHHPTRTLTAHYIHTHNQALKCCISNALHALWLNLLFWMILYPKSAHKYAWTLEIILMQRLTHFLITLILLLCRTVSQGQHSLTFWLASFTINVRSDPLDPLILLTMIVKSSLCHWFLLHSVFGSSDVRRCYVIFPVLLVKPLVFFLWGGCGCLAAGSCLSFWGGCWMFSTWV